MTSQVNGIKPAKVSPAYLHTNSTSHIWPFSAIAELIDNAYDPDVSAIDFWIDHRVVNGVDTLRFKDNGNGMDNDTLYKMLSFGFSDKAQVCDHKPIGQYGNGFKSGSMRLGKDAIVFTRCKTFTSVGLLSQTYLKDINAESVLVPIVTWDLPSFTEQNKTDAEVNLQAILEHSLFKSKDDLLTTLKSLEDIRTGTNIIIYNLQKDTRGMYTLDFKSDPYDIKNPETADVDTASTSKTNTQSSLEYRRSLRDYCSILYMKPRMTIFLREKKVRSKYISRSLRMTETDVYNPGWLDHPIRFTFGFNNTKESSDNYGLMLYNKNRLILAYEKVGCQTKDSKEGVGVVGVVDVDFLEPIHNKQSFNRDDKYRAFMQNAAIKLNDYYYEKSHISNPDLEHVSLERIPDINWVQCDSCRKWRKIPEEYNGTLPEQWYCHQNPDDAFNRCEISEEESDEETKVSYRKTYKKKQEKKKRMLKEQKEKERLEKILKKKARDLNKLKRKPQRKAEELSEGSSSPDDVGKTPTVADHEKQSLKADHKNQLDQDATFQKRDEQRRYVAEQTTAMLRMVDSNTLSYQEHIDEEQNIVGSGSSTMTSISPAFHAPKRKSEMSEVMQDNETKIKKEKFDDVLIDLTGEDTEYDKTDKATQTVPTIVKYVSPEEMDLTKLSSVDARNLLLDKNREVEDKNMELQNLKENIVQLLNIIVPDVDFGEPKDIGSVILDFIKTNNEQLKQAESTQED